MPAIQYIPDGFHAVTPYLVIQGAARLIDFLKAAFGAEELYRGARPDGTIPHALVRIGDSMVEMGEPVEASKVMRAMLHLYVPDTDAVYQRALAAGATPVAEPANQFYGDRVAGVADPCGNLWYISTRMEELSAEEVERRAAAQNQK